MRRGTRGGQPGVRKTELPTSVGSLSPTLALCSQSSDCANRCCRPRRTLRRKPQRHHRGRRGLASDQTPPLAGPSFPSHPFHTGQTVALLLQQSSAHSEKSDLMTRTGVRCPPACFCGRLAAAGLRTRGPHPWLPCSPRPGRAFCGVSSAHRAWPGSCPRLRSPVLTS